MNLKLCKTELAQNKLSIAPQLQVPTVVLGALYGLRAEGTSSPLSVCIISEAERIAL